MTGETQCRRSAALQSNLINGGNINNRKEENGGSRAAWGDIWREASKY